MKISAAIPISLRPIYRGLPIIMAAAVFASLIAKRYLKYTTPLYESTALIKLADNNDGPSGNNLFKNFDVFSSNNKIGAEVELLKSSTLLSKAIRTMNIDLSVYRIGNVQKTEIYNNNPLSILIKLNVSDWYGKPFQLDIQNESITLITPSDSIIKTHFDSTISLINFSFSVSKNNKLIKARPDLHINGKYEFILYSNSQLISDIKKHIDVMSVEKEIPVLRISYKSNIPAKAADVVNSIARAYINDYIETKYVTADTTVGFLDRELITYNNRLRNSEDSIEQYRTDNNIINIKQETETDLRKIADLKKQLINVQMNLWAVDSLDKYIQLGVERFLELAPNFEQFTDLLSTEIILKIKALQAEKKDLLNKYTSENENIKNVNAKIDDLVRYMKESIHNSKISLALKNEELKRGIEESEKVFIGLPTRERQMTALEREFSLNEEQYRFLREKHTEAEIARAAKISFHRIITEGEIPNKPVSPNSSFIQIIAFMIGLFGSTAFIYSIHILKARVTDIDSIQRISELPIIASIPFAEGSARLDLFRKWHIELELKGIIDIGKVYAFSSFKNDEGKEFNAIGLAEAATNAGYKVLLVDVDGEIQLKENKDFTIITCESFYRSWRKKTIEDQIQNWKNKFDVIILKNISADKDPISLQIMSLVDYNFFMLDSRNTKLSSINQFDILHEEMKFSHAMYVFNRADYTPSLTRDLRDLYRKVIILIQNKSPKF